MKPLNKKAYGSIPHLPTSRLGSGDHYISEGQAKIATEKKRDKLDAIIVQEKLDGSNVAVLNLNGRIYALTRSGYQAHTSPYEQHHVFSKWVGKRENRFREMLSDGERLCGEWLYQAHGTLYNLPHEPFVAFDIMREDDRLPYEDFSARCKEFSIIIPHLLSIGEPLSVAEMLKKIEVSGHGAIDPVEGAVWRVERAGKVDFLCKYVRHDKMDGKYFPEFNGGKIILNQSLNTIE